MSSVTLNHYQDIYNGKKNKFHLFQCFARFTSCIAFFNILNELNDYAGQREVVAEEMAHRVYGELMRYAHDLKTERKMVILFYSIIIVL